MKNLGVGPRGPSILDPIYVIYAFGSMLSWILCESQKFSESHKLKSQIGALVPEISSEQRDLWPFGLLGVVWMEWN